MERFTPGTAGFWHLFQVYSRPDPVVHSDEQSLLLQQCSGEVLFLIVAQIPQIFILSLVGKSSDWHLF